MINKHFVHVFYQDFISILSWFIQIRTKQIWTTNLDNIQYIKSKATKIQIVSSFSLYGQKKKPKLSSETPHEQFN